MRHAQAHGQRVISCLTNQMHGMDHHSLDMGAHAAVSWLLGPLEPEADVDVPIPSANLKTVCLALAMLGLGISVVLIVVCATTGKNDLRIGLAAAWIVVLWIALGMLVAGLFASHPTYKGRMIECARWRIKKKELPNPLLDPEDEEISL